MFVESVCIFVSYKKISQWCVYIKDLFKNTLQYVACKQVF